MSLTCAQGRVRIEVGDCRETLRGMPDGSVHCVVTSPPYLGLRDYGAEGQIGLEATPAEFIAEMVGVFREARRVLRDDGTCWINMGDSYVTTPPGNKVNTPQGDGAFNRRMARQTGQGENVEAIFSPGRASGLPAKSLMGMPWRLALALQDDGWLLRQDIIWHKPNPMPESVRDRCTKAHEYVFLLTKGPRYFYDAEAIREAGTKRSPGNGPSGKHISAAESDPKFRTKANLYKIPPAETRNRHSVWTVPSEPFSGAHFATYPPKLIEPCILAGCPRGGVVLDPFGGAGTTGLVAARHGRQAILCEINPAYAEMARERIAKEWREPSTAEECDFGPLFAGGAA